MLILYSKQLTQQQQHKASMQNNIESQGTKISPRYFLTMYL
jgi:hypothetical protein